MRRTRRPDPGDRGIALVDAMIGLTILALVITALFSVFLSGIAQARTASIRGEAAAWARSEVDYLRYVGYTSACLNPGARTITLTSTPCSSLEPPLPAALAWATVRVENNVVQTGLKRITIEISQVPDTVLFRVVTYETQFL